MNLYPGSLRQKVGVGYLVGFFLMLLVGVLNLESFEQVERKVLVADKVSTFAELTFEVRRYEKNFFLYGKAEDYQKLMGHFGRAEGMLAGYAGEFGIFASPSTVAALSALLSEYRLLWENRHKWPDEMLWKKAVREKGRDITTAVEALLAAKTGIIRNVLRSARNRFIVSVLFLTFSGFAAGIIFYRMFIRPMGLLERHMRRITSGEYSLMPAASGDAELVSLINAFNSMLLELEARQERLLMQTAKLVSLGTLVSGVAHQLNNPLSNISTSGQILLEEIEENTIEDKVILLKQIESEVERAKAIVNSLLEFSRKKEFRTEPILLAELMDDTVRLLRCDIPSKVELRVEVPGTINIFGDKQRLEQAFLNIIKNGIDAIADEGQVVVSAHENKESGIVEIKVKDSGTGIAPEDMGRIFEPFFTTKSEGKGTGLGLFVGRQIIEEHNGTIGVESIEGLGTTFTIKLPIKEKRS